MTFLFVTIVFVTLEVLAIAWVGIIGMRRRTAYRPFFALAFALALYYIFVGVLWVKGANDPALREVSEILGNAAALAELGLLLALLLCLLNRSSNE